MSEHSEAATRRRWFHPDGWLGAAIAYGVVAGLACFWRLGATGLISMEGMRPIRSFVRGPESPRRPSYCLLTARDVDELTGFELTGSNRFVFRELGRSDDARWSYRVGTCSTAPGAGPEIRRGGG